MRKSRNTRQKELLNKEIKNLNAFFTAEELFQRIVKKDPKIGIATVYRFLKDLINKRKLHFYTCNRKTIYSCNKESHCHFICEECGKVEHIEIKSIDFIKSKISGEVCHFQIDVFVICEQCRK